MNQADGDRSVAPGTLALADIEEIWSRLFVDPKDEVMTSSARALRGAVCGQGHAILCFGPRVECDSLLQVAREHIAATKTTYAFTHQIPNLYLTFKDTDEWLYVRAAAATLPNWLTQREGAQVLIFAILGPQEAVQYVSHHLNSLLNAKVPSDAEHNGQRAGV